jgi:hypothetical protein
MALLMFSSISPPKTVFVLVAGEVSVVFEEGNIDFYQENPYN